MRETVETLMEDLGDELQNALDGSVNKSDIRISYLKRAIKELEEIWKYSGEDRV